MIVYLISYILALLLSLGKQYYLSGTVLLIAAVWLYYSDYRKAHNFINLRGLFSLFWVGGEGIACFKLSRLQTDWSIKTWICFLAAFIGFWLIYELMSRFDHSSDIRLNTIRRHADFSRYEKGIYISILAVTIISLASFIFEAVYLGFVPFFIRGVPHAYSEFHITGVHYFTVSCVFVPALSVIYYRIARMRNKTKASVVFLADFISLLIPVLCVSRFQLILAVILAALTYTAMEHKINVFYGIALFIAMVPAYIVLTIARSHDVSYLNGIFEMKYVHMPIFITQPYMYISNNYDNFNCLVTGLGAHTLGLKMLFPVLALTGLKFIYPSLVSFPLYLTKPELTTVTLFYDAYYDFGVLGVLILSVLLGYIAYRLVRHLNRVKNPIWYLFYAQFAVYFIFSFFTTWFSNPTTWFYFAVTGIIYIFCEWKK